MKVLALRNCWAGDDLIEEGKVYDLDEHRAKELLRIGRVTEAPAEEPKPKAARKVKADGAE